MNYEFVDVPPWRDGTVLASLRLGMVDDDFFDLP